MDNRLRQVLPLAQKQSRTFRKLLQQEARRNSIGPDLQLRMLHVIFIGIKLHLQHQPDGEMFI